jgi:hypothetical protein
MLCFPLEQLVAYLLLARQAHLGRYTPTICVSIRRRRPRESGGVGIGCLSGFRVRGPVEKVDEDDLLWGLLENHCSQGAGRNWGDG